MGSLRDFGSDLEKKLPQVFTICVIHHRTVNSLCRSFSARQPISEFWLRGKWARANIRIEGGGDDERTLLSPHLSQIQNSEIVFPALKTPRDVRYYETQIVRLSSRNA